MSNIINFLFINGKQISKAAFQNLLETYTNNNTKATDLRVVFEKSVTFIGPYKNMFDFLKDHNQLKRNHHLNITFIDKETRHEIEKYFRNLEVTNPEFKNKEQLVHVHGPSTSENNKQLIINCNKSNLMQVFAYLRSLLQKKEVIIKDLNHTFEFYKMKNFYQYEELKNFLLPLLAQTSTNLAFNLFNEKNADFFLEKLMTKEITLCRCKFLDDNLVLSENTIKNDFLSYYNRQNYYNDLSMQNYCMRKFYTGSLPRNEIIIEPTTKQKKDDLNFKTMGRKSGRKVRPKKKRIYQYKPKSEGSKIILVNDKNFKTFEKSLTRFVVKTKLEDLEKKYSKPKFNPEKLEKIKRCMVDTILQSRKTQNKNIISISIKSLVDIGGKLSNQKVINTRVMYVDEESLSKVTDNKHFDALKETLLSSDNQKQLKERSNIIILNNKILNEHEGKISPSVLNENVISLRKLSQQMVLELMESKNVGTTPKASNSVIPVSFNTLVQGASQKRMGEDAQILKTNKDVFTKFEETLPLLTALKPISQSADLAKDQPIKTKSESVNINSTELIKSTVETTKSKQKIEVELNINLNVNSSVSKTDPVKNLLFEPKSYKSQLEQLMSKKHIPLNESKTEIQVIKSAKSLCESCSDELVLKEMEKLLGKNSINMGTQNKTFQGKKTQILLNKGTKVSPCKTKDTKVLSKPKNPVKKYDTKKLSQIPVPTKNTVVKKKIAAHPRNESYTVLNPKRTLAEKKSSSVFTSATDIIPCFKNALVPLEVKTTKPIQSNKNNAVLQKKPDKLVEAVERMLGVFEVPKLTPPSPKNNPTKKTSKDKLEVCTFKETNVKPSSSKSWPKESAFKVASTKLSEDQVNFKSFNCEGGVILDVENDIFSDALDKPISELKEIHLVDFDKEINTKKGNAKIVDIGHNLKFVSSKNMSTKSGSAKFHIENDSKFDDLLVPSVEEFEAQKIIATKSLDLSKRSPIDNFEEYKVNVIQELRQKNREMTNANEYLNRNFKIQKCSSDSNSYKTDKLKNMKRLLQKKRKEIATGFIGTRKISNDVKVEQTSSVNKPKNELMCIDTLKCELMVPPEQKIPEHQNNIKLSMSLLDPLQSHPFFLHQIMTAGGCINEELQKYTKLLEINETSKVELPNSIKIKEEPFTTFSSLIGGPRPIMEKVHQDTVDKQNASIRDYYATRLNSTIKNILSVKEHEKLPMAEETTQPVLKTGFLNNKNHPKAQIENTKIPKPVSKNCDRFVKNGFLCKKEQFLKEPEEDLDLKEETLTFSSQQQNEVSEFKDVESEEVVEEIIWSKLGLLIENSPPKLYPVSMENAKLESCNEKPVEQKVQLSKPQIQEQNNLQDDTKMVSHAPQFDLLFVTPEIQSNREPSAENASDTKSVSSLKKQEPNDTKSEPFVNKKPFQLKFKYEPVEIRNEDQITPIKMVTTVLETEETLKKAADESLHKQDEDRQSTAYSELSTMIKPRVVRRLKPAKTRAIVVEEVLYDLKELGNKEHCKSLTEFPEVATVDSQKVKSEPILSQNSVAVTGSFPAQRNISGDVEPFEEPKPIVLSSENLRTMKLHLSKPKPMPKIADIQEGKVAELINVFKSHGKQNYYNYLKKKSKDLRPYYKVNDMVPAPSEKPGITRYLSEQTSSTVNQEIKTVPKFSFIRQKFEDRVNLKIASPIKRQEEPVQPQKEEVSDETYLNKFIAKESCLQADKKTMGITDFVEAESDKYEEYFLLQNTEHTKKGDSLSLLNKLATTIKDNFLSISDSPPIPPVEEGNAKLVKNFQSLKKSEDTNPKTTWVEANPTKLEAYFPMETQKEVKRPKPEAKPVTTKYQTAVKNTRINRITKLNLVPKTKAVEQSDAPKTETPTPKPNTTRKTSKNNVEPRQAVCNEKPKTFISTTNRNVFPSMGMVLNSRSRIKVPHELPKEPTKPVKQDPNTNIRNILYRRKSRN